MSYNLPNPSLVGVILTVSTHNGPQIAFSYPEDLCTRRLSSHTNADGTRSDDEDLNEDIDDEDYDEDLDISEDAKSHPLTDSGDRISQHTQKHAPEKLREWDASNPDYYLGTKTDLMSFLDARESFHNVSSGNSSAGAKPASFSSKTACSGAKTGTKNTKNGPKKAGQILGLEPEQLGEMLCPPRAMCNRRFDVMLENVVFLGLPIHVDANGSWRTKKHRRAPTGTATAKSDRNSVSDEDHDDTMSPEPASSNAATAMSMFHLVFVMSPPDIERNYRVDEMFYNVTSKVSLVLRYEQQKHDYVWTQIREISKLKEEFRTGADHKVGVADQKTNVADQKVDSADLADHKTDSAHSAHSADSGLASPHIPAPYHSRSMTSHLISKSPLCKMMADCYTAISASQIANLNINNKLRSFQIPIKMEFHSLPEQTVPYIPGSCLSSTINCLGSSGLVNIGETTRYSNNNLMELLLGMAGPTADPSDDGAADDDADGMNSNPDDIVHLALLLWDDPDVIVKDIKAEPNSAIARFVRMIKPTESLLKISNSLRLQNDTGAQLSIAEIKTFALHLVYWRRARIIPPLNTRAIYIVSPMAPIATNFHRDIARFNQQFPTVPSLPSFLKLLSTRSRKPRQFASIIPSRDHKDMYLLALAWLVRFGYVTQLHTYIWLKVSKKVKMKVEEELEEELGRSRKKGSEQDSRLKKTPAVDIKAHLAVDNSSKQTGNASNDSDKPPFSVDDEIDKLQKRFEASSAIPDLVVEDDGDTILVDPGRASSLERRWINKIIHDECGLSSELTTVFYKLLKYMNGKNSLELLLLRENVSRNELRKLLSEIDEYIISVRHW